jgi:hypothetical protein
MEDDIRTWLSWDRRLIIGIAVGVFALLALVAVQLVLIRASITDTRVMITALTMRVDSMDVHGSRALLEHEKAAHDRAK